MHIYIMLRKWLSSTDGLIYSAMPHAGLEYSNVLIKGGAADPARFGPGGARPPMADGGTRGDAPQYFRGRLPPPSPHLARNSF
jgi:hypothetical protein